MSSVLNFVIVGQQDHPIYEVDLVGTKEVGIVPGMRGLPLDGFANLRRERSCVLRGLFFLQQQSQYIQQFVMHASLDAIDEIMWTTKEPHLKVRSCPQLTLQLLNPLFRSLQPSPTLQERPRPTPLLLLFPATRRRWIASTIWW